MQQVGLTGIEVSATGLKVLIAGFDMFPSLVRKLIVSKGILKLGPTGKLEIQEDSWFPLDVWLSVLEAIHKQIGPNALFKLGTHILENPKFPPWIRDIETALDSIDVAYHRSHRKAGVIMCDQSTGHLMEGIGNYKPKRIVGQKRILVMCDTPYPCETDFGIVTELATKFESKARVAHDPAPCRRVGAAFCTYVVTW